MANNVIRTEEWVFAGRETNGKETQYRYYVPAKKDYRYFAAGRGTASVHSKVIGGIYAVGVAQREDGSEGFLVSSAQYKGRHLDKAMVAEWQACDQTVDATAKAARMVEKGQDDVLEEAMAKLRHAYTRLPPMQRLPFEVWVLNRLRRGK